MKRTQEEIKRQIHGLLEMRKTLPQKSFFGDDNWKTIDAQIAVIQGDEDADDYKHAADDVYSAALDAQDWLNGDNDDDLFDNE